MLLMKSNYPERVLLVKVCLFIRRKTSHASFQLEHMNNGSISLRKGELAKYSTDKQYHNANPLVANKE